jgi:hypothetical protein
VFPVLQIILQAGTSETTREVAHRGETVQLFPVCEVI